MRRWLRTRRARALVALALVLGGGSALVYAVPLPERLSSRSSVVVEYRDGSIAHVFLAEDERYRAPVSLDEIDKAYVEALLRFEDKRFYRHVGVDPWAILRAAALDIIHMGRVSGGSTLTMQLVRVLEPRPRTLWSKGIEALRAVQLELRMTKREILEAYLQFVPYGRNVEGVESASLAYFGHRATNLSAAEIATLLAVPQNPNRRFPTPENAARLRDARNSIASRLFDLGALKVERGGNAAQALEEVKGTAAPSGMRPFPREAIHAAVWLKSARPEVRILTTLDPGLQRMAERLVAQERPEKEHQGIHNAAVVLVDHDAGEVRALVGSFDFFDLGHGGQIVAFDEPRSPGSALKPFIFGFAIDKGLVNPKTLVADIPIAYGSYAPKNFDGKYAGLVRLEDALSKSLNIPFVSLLEKLGVEELLGRLRVMGVKSLSPVAGHYGLSAAIGGVEVTPLELAGLYAALAREGRYKPLEWLRGQKPREPATALSAGATYLVRQALTIRDRPDFPERKRFTGAPPGVAWKTGTSYGHRDAWAAGWLGPLTAVVWMGNVDNSPSVNLVGADASGPLLFDLLEGAQDKAKPSLPPRVPADLTYVEVCAYSGQLATDACPDRMQVLALKRAVPTERCPYHQALDVDLDSGQALTPACRAGHRFERRTYVVWPSQVRRFLSEQDRLLPEPPAVAPGCQEGGERKAPRIISPAAGQIALLLRGVPANEQEIPLEAEVAVPTTLSWFVDGKFVGSAPADDRVWWTPSEGVHDIYVADTAGLSTRRKLEVRTRPQ